MSTPGVVKLTWLWLDITTGPGAKPDVMTGADWYRILDEAAAIGAEGVRFVGGEPTRHPGLPNLIIRAVSRGLRVEVRTDLVQVSSHMWMVFRQPGVSLLTWSDTADRMPQQLVRANVAKAIELGIPVQCLSVDRDDACSARRARLDTKASFDDGGLRRGIADASNRTAHAEPCDRSIGVAAIVADGSVWSRPSCLWAIQIGSVREEPLSLIARRMSRSRGGRS